MTSFRLSFFKVIHSQRRALFAADSFEPLPLHPMVERLLAEASQEQERAPQRVHSLGAFFRRILGTVSGLLGEAVALNSIAAIFLVGTILLSRQLFVGAGGLERGVLLVAGFLVLKGLKAWIEYRAALIRLQTHRAIQLSMYTMINAKLAHIAPAGRFLFSKGELKTLVGSDVEAIEDFLSSAVQQWVPALVTTVVLLPALVYISGWIGVVGLVIYLMVLPIAIAGARIVEHYQVKTQAEQDRLTTTIGEWVKNIRIVRFLGWDAAVEGEVSQRMWRFVVVSALRHLAVLFVYAISYSWSMFPMVGVFWLSAWAAEPFDLLRLFSTFWILDALTFHIQNIPYSISLYGTAAAGAHRVIALLNQPDLEGSILPVPSGSARCEKRPVKLSLRNLGVRLGETQALDDISLDLSLTEHTAIVGSVGSGKTTLLEVLTGELPFSSGRLEVVLEGGEKLPLWREDVYHAFRKLIAYAPQQPFLSNTSMRLNVDLAGDATLEEVEQAAFAAQLTDDIALFPRGFDEEVGESGINLSGGQKQRVSMARAFLSGRPVLILDDPLSAVDTRTEQRLMECIMSRSQGLIIVSHRLAELERCDRVIVLDEGRIVEDGAPRVLLADTASRFSAFIRVLETHTEEQSDDE
jgi:ABC-type multidrug transport system fused ATPase/permease subunit